MGEAIPGLALQIVDPVEIFIINLLKEGDLCQKRPHELSRANKRTKGGTE